MDSDSDMEPEEDDCLPDGDDFVLKSSDEAVLDEPVFVLFCFVCGKRFGKCLFTELSPISTWPVFVTKTAAYSLSQKQTLECILSTCKVSPQLIPKQTHNASPSATILFDYKLL